MGKDGDDRAATSDLTLNTYNKDFEYKLHSCTSYELEYRSLHSSKQKILSLCTPHKFKKRKALVNTRLTNLQRQAGLGNKDYFQASALEVILNTILIELWLVKLGPLCSSEKENYLTFFTPMSRKPQKEQV